VTAGQLLRFHRESVVHNLLGFKKDRVQVRPVLETFRVNLVDALRAANQPLVAITFRPPIEALLPGALVSLPVIGSPASFDAVAACVGPA
jgi:hypothetical protein